MIFAPTPGWLVIAVLVCIVGFFALKLLAYTVAAVILIFKILFCK